MPEKQNGGNSLDDLADLLLDTIDHLRFGLAMRGIHHQQANLLAPVLTDAELLQTHASSSPECRKIAENIAQDAQRVGDANRELRLAIRQNDQRLKPVELESTIRLAVELMRRRKPDSILLEIDIPDTETVVLSTKPMLLAMMYFLMENAWEAIGEEKGTVSVSLKQSLSSDDEDEQVAKIYVSDNGIGMGEKTLQSCRRPLFTTKPHHLGLGLSCAHEIAVRRGELSIESSESGGTTVAVSLPHFN